MRLPKRNGVSLVELLIALSLSAALLTATAVAIDASFKAYQVNQEQASLSQSARVALNRILSTIRETKLHQPVNSTAQFRLGTVVTDTGIQMYDTNGNLITFQLDSVNHKLMAIHDGTSHVLLSGVTTFQIQLQPMKSPEAVKTGGVYDLLKRATVLITLETTATTAQSSETTGRQQITISSSVSPRQNVW